MSSGYRLTAQVSSWLPAPPDRADRSMRADPLPLEGEPALAVSPPARLHAAPPPRTHTELSERTCGRAQGSSREEARLLTRWSPTARPPHGQDGKIAKPRRGRGQRCSFSGSQWFGDLWGPQDSLGVGGDHRQGACCWSCEPFQSNRKPLNCIMEIVRSPCLSPTSPHTPCYGSSLNPL